jgi:peroxiredoxin
MEKFIKIGLFIAFAVLTLSAANATNAQAVASTPKPAVPSTIFRDSDGNLISNNEFVDIRMANFHYKDATVTKILDDGTVEFRLQKIPQEGMNAPDFSVKDIHGDEVNSADLKGKVVVLNFWFIGCPACIAETPKLNELKAKFADEPDAVFLALTYEPSGKVKHYLSRERFDYRVAGDADEAMKKFVFSGYPKNIVIGRDGKIVYWRSPVHAWEKFESVIRGELQKD